MSSQAGLMRIMVPSDVEQPLQQQQGVQSLVDGRVVTTSVRSLPDRMQSYVQQAQQQRLQQHLNQRQRQQQGVQQAQQRRLQLFALHQQGRLAPAGMQWLQIQEQQEAAGNLAPSQQQQQQQQQVRHASEERRGAAIASADVPVAAAPIAMAIAEQAGPQPSTTSMGLMTSLVAQLAAANPVPEGTPIMTPRQVHLCAVVQHVRPGRHPDRRRHDVA